MNAFLTVWAEATRAAWRWSSVWDAAVCAGILLAIWLAIRAALAGEEHSDAPPEGRSGTAAAWTALAAATLLGLALRLHGRDVLPYWWDELLAVWMAQADVAAIFRSLFTPAAPASDFTPPLFYLLLHAWVGAFGAGEAQVRVLTALFSSAQIPLIALLGRRLFSWRAGLAAALLLAFSPPAIFYAQQARCYSLLGLLALAVALCAVRALESGRGRDLIALGVTGTLFLYTHYVAAWLWVGMGAATLAAVMASWIPEASASPRRKAGLAATVLAGFALAALCPWFAPPLLADSGALWAVILAAILAMAMLAGRPWAPAARRDVRFGAGMAAAFAVPGALLCLWMLPSGVVKVIGGPGSRIPGSYGFPEFARMLAEFSGPQAVLDPAMAGLGLFLALSGLYLALAARPRQALLLMGWAAFPMAMAMAVQNPSMNLVRYLIATLPAVLLLVAAALCGACDGLGAVLSRLLRVPPGRAAMAGLLAPAVLGAALLGYRAYTATAFPATRANIEDYPAAAARLAGMGGFFLAGESQNLVRALSWYMDRQGRASVEFGPGSPRLAAANVFLDGRFWHADTAANLGLADARAIEGRFGEIALFARASDGGEDLTVMPGPDGSVDLRGAALRDRAIRGRDAAFAGNNAGGLVQLYKKRPGSAVYRIRHEGAGPGWLTLGLEGVAAGLGSRIEVLVRDASGEVLIGAALGGMGLTPLPGTLGESGEGVVRARLEKPLPPGEGEVEVVLRDGNTGVIYSSNVILRSVTLRLPGHGAKD